MMTEGGLISDLRRLRPASISGSAPQLGLSPQSKVTYEIFLSTRADSVTLKSIS